MLEKGYIQVYTGNGKGKTTAALGISLRTICAGNKVFFGQFMKGQCYSELKACELLPGMAMEQFGSVCFINGKPTEKDYADARKGLDRMKEVLSSGDYDIVVFDEINTSLFFHLVTVEEVLAVLDLKPEKTEVILTGRYAPDEIIQRADLVTEMKEIKHYYNSGVDSRVGIEN
ncbi:cob(I)yrinic acid a,c-diamide adenosyltransferase [Sinanaerobacter chloroacetimidivorans]|jgi:cob(I)alamin adenosyltransferase|uniref:Cob(I)yrinic acid a,c-diamide adenosyltransferase n=1 Tax=Sinanaerobacter chloroacetimidivorans TaxID=2818044 RepID=A0A8J8B2K2_9FIRM|nr:cob(I)yrinic acid a,c-diamide adenosyltransferase [Sinanaerobacter chloroacetimidivorans]MBR0598822.1 cob(I)yrinic acid a,c-diamide adenosyltransferase [Sinanaerobacter chloroacetimidivorans]